MTEATVAHAPSTTTTRRLAVRPLSLVVLAVAVAVVVALSLIARTVLRDQEDRLLEERTAEVVALLEGAIGSVESSLRTLGSVSGTAADPARVFRESARPLVQGNVVALGLAEQRAGTFVLRAAVGQTPQEGSTLGGERAELLRRAADADGMVTGLFAEPGGTRLSFVFHAAGATPVAVYQDSAVAPEQPAESTPDSPFRELNVALYATPRADPSELIVATTRDVPLSGTVERDRMEAGADEWLVVASADRPLIGAFAQAVPWMILGGGLLAAALATTVVETLARRRRYAEEVAERRTVELTEAQAQLVRQERMAAVGQLASAVGHELRNPLGVIMNVLYLLESDLGPDADERATRHLGTARRELSAATLIVSDLLDFSAAREPMPAPVDLPGLVDEALSVSPPPTGIEVVRRGGEGLSSIIADRDQLRQVLLNLITNAYEAMPDGGQVTVEIADEPSAVRIAVADTGVGMDDETKGELFTPFFTRKPRGIGLGLAVTKRIVDAHGGTIDVDSRPGGGTSFRVVLPTGPRRAEERSA